VKIVPDYWDEELETISPEQFRERQTLKMQKHLRYAYQNSQFYKRKFDRVGLRPEEIKTLDDFRRQVPWLTHEELINDQKENSPFGDILTVNIKEIRRIYCSPGPLVMPFSKNDMDAFINSTANGLYICGARRGDIVDITYGYQWDLAGTMLDDGFRRLGCAVVPGGTGMTRTHLIIMHHLGVTAIFAFPSFGLKLAETAKEMGMDPRRDLKVRLIIIGQEVWDENDKKMLAEEYGAEVRAIYGGAEAGLVAAECSYGGGMHWYSDSIMEVIDPATGRPVPDGQPGEIVTTDLSRKGLPLIRYRTGDITLGLNTRPCPCGRTSPRLGRIIGRTGGILRVKGVYLVPDLIKKVVSGYEMLGRFQIIVDRVKLRDNLALRIETSAEENSDQIRRKLEQHLRAVTRLRAEITFVPRGTIPADAPLVADKRYS